MSTGHFSFSGSPSDFGDRALREQRELASEVKANWRRGATADARDFLDRHRDLTWDKSVVLDLAYEQYCLLVETGKHVDVAEFCDRFPMIAKSLKKLLDGHNLLDQNLHLLDPNLAAEPRWPELGETLLGFRLLAELGRGSFARVYLASQPSLGGRLVAVKL